jgi:hypothetical protein
MSYYQATSVSRPRPVSRWLIPLLVGLLAGILGIALGSASASDASGCEALADEYAALVSDGLDAGLSGDEAQMLDVAQRRDALSEDVKNSC